jgi:hypothetical protein
VVNLAMAEDRYLTDQLRELRIYCTRQHIPDRPVERTGVPEHTSYATYTVTGL